MRASRVTISSYRLGSNPKAAWNAKSNAHGRLWSWGRPSWMGVMSTKRGLAPSKGSRFCSAPAEWRAWGTAGPECLKGLLPPEELEIWGT